MQVHHLEMDRRESFFIKRNLLKLVGKEENSDHTNEQFRRQVVHNLFYLKIDWIGGDKVGELLWQTSMRLPSEGLESTNKSIAAQRFLDRLSRIDSRLGGSKLKSKLPPIGIRNGDLGPTNYNDSSCWCDSTLVALFMSTTKADFLLSGRITRLTWMTESWAEDSKGFEPTLASDISRKEMEANALMNYTRELVDTMRSQISIEEEAITNLRVERPLGSEYYSHIMKEKVEKIVNLLAAFGMDKGSKLTYKDSVEAVTYIANILGSFDEWRPICVLRRKYLYASLPADKFSSIPLDPENKNYKYEVKSTANFTERSLVYPKDRNGNRTTQEYVASELIQKNVVTLRLSNEPISISGRAAFIEVGDGSSPAEGSLQHMVDFALKNTLLSVEVITERDTTVIERIIDLGLELRPVSSSSTLSGLVPCTVFKETTEVLYPPDVLVMQMGKRGGGEGVIDNKEVKMFDGSGHARVNINQADRTFTYEVVGASHFVTPHYTAYIRPIGAERWFHYNDIPGEFKQANNDSAMKEIQSNGYFLVLERLE